MARRKVKVSEITLDEAEKRDSKLVGLRIDNNTIILVDKSKRTKEYATEYKNRLENYRLKNS
jgi:hypothetical protein